MVDAQTRIAGVANLEAALTVASGIVTVFDDVSATPTVRVAPAGWSQVIKLQSQVAAVTVISKNSSWDEARF